MLGSSAGRAVFFTFLCAAAAACGDNLGPPELVGDASLQTTAPSEAPAGNPIAVTCTLTEGDVTDAVPADLVVSPEDAVMRDGDEIVAIVAGTIEVACALTDRALVDPTPAVVEIVAGAPLQVTTTVMPNPVIAGETMTATCTVFDAQGNLVEDADPTLGLTPTDPGNVIAGLEVEMTRAGTFNAECQVPGASGDGVEVEVLPALPASIVLGQDPDVSVHPVGAVVDVTHQIFDRFGNEVPDATVTLDSTPVTGDGPTTVLGPATFQYDGEGLYRVDALVDPPTDLDLDVSASIDITIDSEGPRLRCDSPGDATMLDVTPGSVVTFTGAAIDANGVVDAIVNGDPVTVAEDGTFSAPITTRFGINFVEVSAADDNDLDSTRLCAFLVADQWGSPFSSLANTVMLQLRQASWDDGSRSGSINSFDDILAVVLNSQGLKTAVHNALTAANPLKPSSCDQEICIPFVGCACVLRSEITYISSELNGPNTSQLTLVNGGLAVGTRIDNPRIKLRARGSVAGIPYDTTGWVNIDFIDVHLVVDTALSGGLPNVTVRAGSVTVQVGSISTDFSGIDGAIINIIASIANGQVRTIVANTMRDFVVNNFNSVLDGLIGNLDVSSLGAAFDVPRIGGGTIPVSFGLGFSSLSTTTSRMLIGIATRFTAPITTSYPTLGTPVPPGPVLVDPSSTTAATVAAHVALFNGLLHALWRGGMFDMTLDGDDISPDLPNGVAATIVTRLPPVAMIEGSTIVLHIGAMEATLTHPDLPEGLRVAIGATARATVSLVGNDLQFGGVTIEELHFSSDQFEIGPSELADLEDLALPLLQKFADTSLNDALPSLPLPTFTIPASLAVYGLPAGDELGLTSPTLTVAPQHFTLRGAFGIVP